MPTDQQAEFHKRVARIERKSRPVFGRAGSRRPAPRGMSGRVFGAVIAALRICVTLTILAIVLKTLALYGLGETRYRSTIQQAVADFPPALPIQPALLPDPFTLSLARALPR